MACRAWIQIAVRSACAGPFSINGDGASNSSPVCSICALIPLNARARSPEWLATFNSRKSGRFHPRCRWPPLPATHPVRDSVSCRVPFPDARWLALTPTAFYNRPKAPRLSETGAESRGTGQMNPSDLTVPVYRYRKLCGSMSTATRRLAGGFGQFDSQVAIAACIGA